MALKLEDQLGYNLNRTAMLFRRELMRALRPFGSMTPEQWQTLNVLWSSEHPLSPSQIRDVTLQDLPSISRMIKRMEEQGWVKRKPDPQDGRSFRVELTAKGRNLEQKLPVALLDHFQAILSVLGEEESQSLMMALKKLRAALGDESSG